MIKDMNILLINHYAGSSNHGMEYRPFYLAREWVKSGHRVSIIAASYSHLRSSSPSLKERITHEVIEGINYFWIRTPRYQGRGIGRIINMMIFSFMLIIKKTEIVHECNPDVVIASSPHPFIIHGAFKIARSTDARLVFEVRDLWPLELIEVTKVSPWHPFLLMMQWVENYAYRNSDHVVSLLPKADGYMENHGMESHKFSYVPNGADVYGWQTNRTSLPEHHAEAIFKLKSKGHFIVGYAGSHGLPNALHILIEAAVLLKSEPVTFVLVGKGLEKLNLKRRVSELGLENIIFLDPILKTSIPAFLDLMDVLYIGWLKSPLYRFGISPNKLLDYMMSSKPIIHAVDAGNDLVAESHCGISIPPEDPGAIAKAVVSLMNMSDAERESMGLRGKEYVIEYHDYNILSKRFIEIVTQQ